MQSVRSNLTRLKNQVEASLPGEGDLFEFPGVTRALLISLLESASAESYELIDKEESDEIILLKRKLAQPFETCRDYLYDFKGGKKEKKYFDEFVRALTEIRDHIRLTYLICNKSGLRTEDDIQAARESLAELMDCKEKLQIDVQTLLAIHDELKQKLDAVAIAEEQAQESLETAVEAGNSISSVQSKSSASFEVIAKYEKQIAESKEAAVQNSSEISVIATRGKQAISELDTAQSELAEITGETQRLQSACKELNAEIASTLEAANRVGMAGSFNSRKEELKASLVLWAICFVVSIGAILGIGLWMIYPYLGQSALQMNLEDVGLKLLVVAPLVWLAWMSARQYGYLSRIREDYSFKYATAMAFEGYKKQAQEINELLLNQLLKQAIETVGQNPIRLYSSKDNHASPVQEAIDKAKDVVTDVLSKKAESD
jgi:hypothetical protein